MGARFSSLLLAGVVGFFPAAPAVLAGETAEVGIVGHAFVPAELTVKVGTTVRWTNREKRVSHSVVFLGQGGGESERFFPGESWSRSFDRPGTYDYTCEPHPEMKGRIIVESPGPGASRRDELVRLVRQDCGSCHGMTLKGGLGLPLTADALRGKPAESLSATIIYGRPGTAMPPWSRFLNETEADWIVGRLMAGFPEEGAR